MSAVSLRLGVRFRDARARIGKKALSSLAGIGPPAVEALLGVLATRPGDAGWAAAVDAVANLAPTGPSLNRPPSRKGGGRVLTGLAEWSATRFAAAHGRRGLQEAGAGANAVRQKAWAR